MNAIDREAIVVAKVWQAGWIDETENRPEALLSVNDTPYRPRALHVEAGVQEDQRDWITAHERVDQLTLQARVPDAASLIERAQVESPLSLILQKVRDGVRRLHNAVLVELHPYTVAVVEPNSLNPRQTAQELLACPACPRCVRRFEDLSDG